MKPIRTFLTSLFALALFAQSATAATCADLSGEYRLTPTSAVKFEQKNCERLEQYSGSFDKDQNVHFTHYRTLLLDGTPDCDTPYACTVAVPDRGSIVLSTSYDSEILTAEHGKCTYKKVRCNRDNSRSLNLEIELANCSDQYSGSYKMRLPPLKKSWWRR